MGRILYKDIELDEANKEVHFAHSRFTERDINTDWMAGTSNPSWNSTRSTSANPSTQSGSAVVPPMRRVAATLPAKPAT